MNEPSHAKVWLSIDRSESCWSIPSTRATLLGRNECRMQKLQTGSHFGAIQEPQITHIFSSLS